jgi:hypothetical protein
MEGFGEAPGTLWVWALGLPEIASLAPIKRHRCLIGAKKIYCEGTPRGYPAPRAPSFGVALRSKQLGGCRIWIDLARGDLIYQ